MDIADWILIVIAAYLVAGVIFAIAFVAAGAARIDSAARGSRLGFRVLLIPGSIALWPVLAQKWMNAP